MGGLAFPEGEVYSLSYSPDGLWLYAAGGKGSQSGSFVAWKVPDYRRITKIEFDKDIALAMDVSPDGRWVALGGPTKRLRVYRIEDQKLLFENKKHADWITSVAFSKDGVLLASGDRFGSIHLWEIPKGGHFHSLRGHQGAISSIDWSDDSNHLTSSGQDGKIVVTDLLSHTEEQVWQSHPAGWTRVLALDGKWLSVGQDNRLSFWTNPAKQHWSKTLNRPPTSFGFS